MAAKTFYLKNTAISGFGSLSETDPGASTTGTGWISGKTASGNFSALLFGTERAASAFSTTDYLVTTHPNPGSGDSWRSENTINGTFANANWVLTFAVRAVTSASTQRGRVKVRLWRSVNADGSSATEITSATLSGGIIAGISTTVDNTSVVTFSPGATITLTNEYLFVQCEWEITTAGGTSGADIDFRAGTPSTVVTSDFTPAAQTLTPGLFTNSQSYFTQTVGATVNLAPSLFTNTQSYFSQTVGATYDLAPALFSNAQTFYTQTIDTGGAAQDLAPALFVNAQVFELGPIDFFFTPEVAIPVGSPDLTPPFYVNSQGFFAQTVSATADLAPPLYSNTQTFYAPTVGATANLAPSRYDNAQTFFQPTVSGVATIAPSLFTNTQTFFSPIVSAGDTFLAPNLFTNTQTFFTPTVLAVATLAPTLFTNTQTFFTPTVGASVTLTPSLFSNAQTFYAATVGSSYGLTSPLLTNTQSFFAPTVTPGTADLAPAIFLNSQTFYAPLIQVGGVAPSQPSANPMIASMGMMMVR